MLLQLVIQHRHLNLEMYFIVQKFVWYLLCAGCKFKSYSIFIHYSVFNILRLIVFTFTDKRETKYKNNMMNAINMLIHILKIKIWWLQKNDGCNLYINTFPHISFWNTAQNHKKRLDCMLLYFFFEIFTRLVAYRSKNNAAQIQSNF